VARAEPSILKKDIGEWIDQRAKSMRSSYKLTSLDKTQYYLETKRIWMRETG